MSSLCMINFLWKETYFAHWYTSEVKNYKRRKGPFRSETKGVDGREIYKRNNNIDK